eukprot:758874-Hanusia_phi.AAC.2
MSRVGSRTGRRRASGGECWFDAAADPVAGACSVAAPVWHVSLLYSHDIAFSNKPKRKFEEEEEEELSDDPISPPQYVLSTPRTPFTPNKYAAIPQDMGRGLCTPRKVAQRLDLDVEKEVFSAEALGALERQSLLHDLPNPLSKICPTDHYQVLRASRPRPPVTLWRPEASRRCLPGLTPQLTEASGKALETAVRGDVHGESDPFCALESSNASLLPSSRLLQAVLAGIVTGKPWGLPDVTLPGAAVER